MGVGVWMYRQSDLPQGSFDLSCPILEKDNFIKDLYFVLSY